MPDHSPFDPHLASSEAALKRFPRFVVVAIIVLIAGMIILTGVFPTRTNDKPQAGTPSSDIKYSLGEKVKAKAYGSDWYDAKITGIISEDDYIVDFCGAIGWAHRWECKTGQQFKRVNLAKVEQ